MAKGGGWKDLPDDSDTDFTYKAKADDDVELRQQCPPVNEDDNGLQSGRIRDIFAFTKRSHLPVLLIAVLASAAAGAVSPVSTIFLGRIFEAYSNYGIGKYTSAQLLANTRLNIKIYAGLGACSWFLNAVSFMAWIVFGELQADSSRSRLFEALLGKSMSWHDMQKVGIASRLPRFYADVRNLQMSTAQPLGTMFESVVTAIVALGVAFWHSWSVPLITFSTIPIAVVLLSILTVRMQSSVMAQNAQLLKAAERAYNAFMAIETVKCFNGQGIELGRWTGYIRRAADYYFTQARYNGLQMAFLAFFTQSMFVQGFWYGCHLVNIHEKNTSDIITTFWSCITATQALQAIVPQFLVIEKGKAAGKTLRQVVEEKEPGTMQNGRNYVEPSECAGHIVFRGVSFAYPSRPDQVVLKNFDCNFKPGETTFVVGASGSGKSTIAQLLLRFYEPSAGLMFLDGIPINLLNPTWIRENVTLVEQQSTLFQGSFLYNIALGKPDENCLEVKDVAESAQFALLRQTIDDFPIGFHSDIGRNGSRLSGGQRQRLAIARAHMRNTPIMILDESTSALDHITRGLLITAVRQWRKGRTTIIVTHDLSQVESDDFVYVLNRGELIAEGRREELEERIDIEHFTKSFATAAEVVEEYEAEKTPQVATVAENANRRSSKRDSMVINKRSSMIASAKPSRPLSMMPTMMFPSVLSAASSRVSAVGTVNGLSSLSGVGPSYSFNAGFVDQQNASEAFRRRNNKSRLQQWPIVHEDSLKPPSPTKMAMFDQATMQLIESSGMTAVTNRLTTSRKGPRQSHAHRLSTMPPPLDEDTSDIQHTFIPKIGVTSLTGILGTVWPALTPRQRASFLLAFVCAIVHATGNPIFAFIFSRLLATLTAPGNQAHTQLKWSLAILGLAFGDGIATYYMHYLLEHCGQKWVDSVRETAMARLLAQPREYFSAEGASPGAMVQVLDRNAEEMRNLLGRFFVAVFVAVLMMIVAVVWSLVSCWELALVGLAMCPVAILITRVYKTVGNIMEGRSNLAHGAVGIVLAECFSSVRTVKALSLDRTFRRRYHAAGDVAIRAGIRRALYTGFLWGLSESIVLFTNTLLLYVAAVLIAKNAFSLKSVLVVVSQLTFGVAALTTIAAIIPQIATSRDTALELLALARLPATSHESTGSVRADALGDITATDLDFSYAATPGVRVLSDISLRIPAGSAVAIVGPSGSGKSTLASLLLRLYPTPATPPGGLPRLALAGRDIAALAVTHLRARVALVPQTPVLFPATVFANIVYGLPLDSAHSTLAAARAAARDAGVDAFIMSLPAGYDTLLGESGAGLSGGQAQRVAIARALVRRPDVLLLDEATSALDYEAARGVRETLARLIKREQGRLTVVMVTHAREMMEMAGRVVMLEHGRVVDDGRFDELIRGTGRFARLMRGGVWEGELGG